MEWHDLDLWILRIGIFALLLIGVARMVDCELRRFFRDLHRLQRRVNPQVTFFWTAWEAAATSASQTACPLFLQKSVAASGTGLATV